MLLSSQQKKPMLQTINNWAAPKTAGPIGPSTIGKPVNAGQRLCKLQVARLVFLVTALPQGTFIAGCTCLLCCCSEQAWLTGLPLSRSTPVSSFKHVRNRLFKFFTRRTYYFASYSANHPSSARFALLLHAFCTLQCMQCRHTQFMQKANKAKLCVLCMLTHHLLCILLRLVPLTSRPHENVHNPYEVCRLHSHLQVPSRYADSAHGTTAFGSSSYSCSGCKPGTGVESLCVQRFLLHVFSGRHALRADRRAIRWSGTPCANFERLCRNSQVQSS
jgi:hypothetical protein